MDEHGIARAVVTAGGLMGIAQLSRHVVEGGFVDTDADNAAVLVACRASDGRLLPFYFANPHRPPGEYRAAAADFVGMELSPAVHGVPLADERTSALIAIAAEVGHPVYLVCIGRPGCAVRDLSRLARTFPQVTFVLGHCGFIGIDVHALTVVADTPNIMAETSGCYTGVARAALDLLGADRVLFGTEYPLQHPAVELAKLDALELDPATRAKLAWHNGHRILPGTAQPAESAA
jgi:predicted TIM-barrel fold metal-dependent hydrolase